jgi:hypothetical protein
MLVIVAQGPKVRPQNQVGAEMLQEILPEIGSRGTKFYFSFKGRFRPSLFQISKLIDTRIIVLVPKDSEILIKCRYSADTMQKKKIF